MRFSYLRSTAQRVHSFLLSTRGTSLVCGSLAGVFLLTLCHQFSATLGSSLSVATALGFALAVGIAWGSRGPHRLTVSRPACFSFGLMHLGLAAWVVAFPWLMRLAAAAAAQFHVETVASPAVGPFLHGTAAALLLIVPACWIARLPRTLCLARAESQPFAQTASLEPRDGAQPASCSSLFPLVVRYYLGGVTLGMLLQIFFLAPVIGVQLGGSLAAAIGAGLFLPGMFREETPFAGKADLPGGSHTIRQTWVSADVLQPAVANLPNASFWRAHTLWVGAAVGCFGALLALVFRATHQLMPAASFVVHTEWAAVIAGLMLGLRSAEHRLKRDARRTPLEALACLGVAAWCIGLLMVFSLLVDVLLILNSSISHGWLQMTARSLIAAVLVLPIGFGWGLLAGCSGLRAVQPLALAGGFFLIRWTALSYGSVGELVVVTTWLLVALAAARRLLTRDPAGSWRLSFSAGWVKKVAVAAAVCLVAAGPLIWGNYDPRRSSRLLFATNVFMARQAGFGADLLPFLDEGRHLATVEGDRGTYTVWKFRGAQLQVRENGVPKGVVSTDPAMSPHYSAEVMQAAMPLVLHEAPHRVLVLGLSGGVPLTTCLSFPVLELTCVEPDSGLRALLEETVWPLSGESPLADDRVRFLPVDAALALACRDAEYDVIVSCPDQSILMQATPEFTLDFYRRAARRLADDGIFCQRFRHIDYGPEPIQVAAKTMQAAFSNVTAVETAPGELLLLGTNSPGGLSCDGLVSRLQAPHVRRMLSQVGWDWSVPLNITTYDHEALASFVEDGNAGVNTAANGHFAFRLPPEVMRWGPKLQETRAQLSPRAGRFLAWEGIDGEDPELLHRLSEVAGQRKLMTQFPDQPWTYRKSLREQLTDRPRSHIQQVGGKFADRRLHPEDRRRKEYFEVLGEAAKHPEPQAIRRVAEFASPYDPLMSYFVHYEMAELYARAKDRDVRSELAHRLHLIYYADSRDRSVRDVVAALEMLIEHPHALPEPRERWDQIDALMQVLKTRWETRGGAPPVSTHVVLNDIERSISALETSFAEMERLSRELGFSEAGWQSRRTFLEKALVRPLRTYRSRLLPHHLKPDRHAQRQPHENATAAP